MFAGTKTGIAQLVERTALNRMVKGSIPFAGVTQYSIVGVRWAHNPET